MLDSRSKKIRVGGIIALLFVVMILFMPTYTSTNAFAASSKNNNRVSGGVYVHDDTSYVKGIKINDVDRSSPHIIKVILARTDDYPSPHFSCGGW